jgi:hypothetical protein
VYWPKLQEKVSKYIQRCVICIISNPSHYQFTWESISIGLIGIFPMMKQGHDYLFVVAYIFEMCMFMPSKKTIKGHKTIDLLFSSVWVHIGFPHLIVSN